MHSVTCANPRCGKLFEAASKRARYCSSTCRSQVSRAGGLRAVSDKQATAQSVARAVETGEVTTAVGAELEVLEVHETALARAALALARRIDDPETPASAVASLVKQLVVTLEEAKRPARRTDRDIDRTREAVATKLEAVGAS